MQISAGRKNYLSFHNGGIKLVKKVVLLYAEVCCILFILIGSSFSVTAFLNTTEKSSQYSLPVPTVSLERKTWYVGGGGPGNYSTIQGAIDAASNGDKIIVYAKTYYENEITINKAVNIQGAGLTSTIIDGSGATLASEGLVKITAKGNVTFSGFTVQNAGGPIGFGGGDNKLNMGITAYTTASGCTYTISSTKIIGTNNPDDDYDWGFYAISGGKENIIFSHNIITQTGCNNMVIEKTTGFTDISYNSLDAGCWGIDSIYYMTYGGTDVVTQQKISNNTIDIGTGINPGGALYNKITAIGFSSAYLGCTGVPDTGKYTNILISDNTIDNVKEWRRGIALDNFAWSDGSGGEISNAIIKGNVITGVSSSPPSFALRLSGLVTHTIIRENQITNCDMSFWGRTGYYGSSIAYPTDILMKYNNFQDNPEGVTWEGPTKLNAQLNWWGALQGGDPISGDVDYSPWLGAPYGTIPMTICTDDNINEAMNATNDGDTVFVTEGTYYEHLTISKRITVIGEDSNTTIIDGSSTGKVVTITSDNVSIKRFTLQKSGVFEGDAGIYVRSNGNAIDGNIIKKNAEGIHLWSSTNNRITNNKFSECTYALYMQNSDSNTIKDNTITFNTQGILLEASSSNDVNGNYITNNKNGIWLQSYCDLNSIAGNHIASNTIRGLYLERLADKNTIIYHNNFIGNAVNAYFETTLFSKWDRNYWDDWIGVKIPQFQSFPKVIVGRFFSFIPWINFDRYPSPTAYPI